MSIALDVRLRPEARACAEARARIAELRPPLEAGAAEDAALLVSELVANSIRHGSLRPDDDVRLVVELEPQALRVRVTDPGPGFRHGPGKPVPRPPGGGWGLVLLDRLADRWGTREEGGATTVWFELRHRGRGLGADRSGYAPASPNEEAPVSDPKIDEAKGRAKQAAGDLLDDDELKREGALDRAGASVKEKTGEAKDKADEVVDRLKDKASEVLDEDDA